MEQLERTQRYLDRMRRAYAGADTEWQHRKEHEDDVFSFFIHCFHIGDWIVTLNKLGVGEGEVKRFIESHECLRICGDLCNGTKHCALTRKKFTSRQPHLVGRTHSGGSDSMSGKLHSRFTIMSSGQVFDALELAENCMKAWIEYTANLQARYDKSRRIEESAAG